MPIRILPTEVANQIAAGEVVERPASVVKELVENSLDAGATDIRVEIREGGRRLVRVQDDGCGIPAAEAALAFARHATSKITTADDLTHLTTLGFRGEALASIGAVSQVTLVTRARAEEIGTLLRKSEGYEAAQEPHGAPPGTIITVEHLFANLPARLKFLKQPATEASHTQQIITRFALAYPDRRFSLVSDGKLVFQSTGSGKLYDVLAKVYGLELAREMIEVAGEQIGKSANQQIGEAAEPRVDEMRFADSPSTIRVSGYTGAPTLHRANRGYITLFVNRRWFQDTSIGYSVIQAYHTLLPVGRYPVAVIFIEIDPAEVDVNVHPTKAEVRFRETNRVYAAVQRAVRRALVALHHAPIPQVSLGGAGAAPEGSPAAWAAPDEGRAAPFGGPAWAERRDALLNAGAGQARLFAGGGLEPGSGVGSQGSGGRGQGDGLPASGFPAPSDDRGRAALLPLLRVVGQLGATYVICEGPDGLYLIDQHAAHERVLYEQFLAERAAQKLAIQPLLEPLVLDLSPEQAAVAAEELGTLHELGIAIEPFGGSSYLVRSLPAILSKDSPQAAVIEIVDGLAQADDVVGATHEAALITLICKRAAVKGGQVLSLTEMQELVRRLEACRSPRTCPHGRPTMIHVSATELARMFGRQ
jgi:DNA mismatch repair protein MutL